MRPMVRTVVLLVASSGVFVSGLDGLAWAQRVDIETRPPAAQRGVDVVPPGLHEQVTRPPDADFYPEGPRVQHDPAFVEPLAADTGTGRVGLSAWTAPQTPAGPGVSGHRDVSGWLAIGFSVTWGAPPAPPKRPPAR